MNKTKVIPFEEPNKTWLERNRTTKKNTKKKEEAYP